MHSRFDGGPVSRRGAELTGDLYNGSLGVLCEVRVGNREAVPEPHEVLERWCYPPVSLSGRR